MNTRLDEVLELARSIPTAPDARPIGFRIQRHADDPVFLYYRFLYELAIRYGPFEALEIGTFVGVSAAHLAAHPGNRVITVDVNPDAKLQADRLAAALGLSNLTAVTADSISFGKGLAREPRFDVLFIDGLHNFNQVYGEYELYRPRVRQGGLILFDDIDLPMATREMQVFWNDYVVDPKIDLAWLHDTGFGVAQVDHEKRLPSWSSVIKEAGRKFVR